MNNTITMPNTPRAASLNSLLHHSTLLSDSSAAFSSAPICDTPERDALDMVLDTYLAWLLDAREPRPVTPMPERAARALDHASPPLEESIARLCAQPLPKTGNSLQHRFVREAVACFDEAIRTRQAAAQLITLHPDQLISALRATGLPNPHLLSDEVLTQALSGPFIDKLRRALVKLAPDAAQPMLGTSSVDQPTLRAALARIEPTRRVWQQTLMRETLKPCITHNRALFQQEYDRNKKLVGGLAALSPTSLAARLDALDACDEDALAFLNNQVVSREQDEYMGIPRDQWLALEGQIKARAQASNGAGPRLDDLSQAIRALRDNMSPRDSILCGLLMPAPLNARVQRSIASSLHCGSGSEAAGVNEALQRIHAADPALVAHLDRIENFLLRFGRSFPLLGNVLDAVLPAMAEKGLRTGADASDARRHLERAIIEAAGPAARAAHSAIIGQLIHDCRNTLNIHRDIWAGTRGLDWLLQLWNSSRLLTQKSAQLEADLKTLGFDITSELGKQLVQSALQGGMKHAVGRWSFKSWVSSDADAAASLHEALLLPNGKFHEPVRLLLKEMRQGTNPARAALADGVERLAARLRSHTDNSRQATQGQQASESLLLEAAIISAQTARRQLSELGREDDIEHATDRFLAKMPRGGAHAKRQNAVMRYLEGLPALDLIELAIHARNRKLFFLRDGSSGPYRKHLGLEKDMLSRILPALSDLDRRNRQRLTIGEMRARFMSGHTAQSGEHPDATRAAYNRAIMATDMLLDLAVSLRKNRGTPEEHAQNISIACAEARACYIDLNRKLNALGEIAKPIRLIWGQTIDGYAQNLPDHTSLGPAINNCALIYPIGDMVSPPILAQWHDRLLAELDQAPVSARISALVRALEANLVSGLQASPVHHALLFACSTVVEYHHAHRAGEAD